jgi:hypothetical protein
MVVITNFGDVVTTGNTSVALSLNVQGAYSYFGGSITGAGGASFSNVLTVTLNATTLNTTSIFGTQGFVGIGTTDPSGTSLLVSGNMYVSNTLTTTNLFVTQANVLTLNTANLYVTSLVQGNLIVSGNVTVTNVQATLINTSTINVTNFFLNSSNLGINTTGPQGATLYVGGNVYVSNALTTGNVFAAQANVTVLNYGVSLVSATLSGANVIVQGNLFVGNNLTTQTLYYGEDLFKRGPFLQPGPANGPTIQAWISATSNASTQPFPSWWAVASSPAFGNVGATGGTWFGSVLLPDGRVLFVPNGTGTQLGFFNPATGLFSTSAFGFSGFRGAVPTPDGNVCLIPSGSNVVVLNPLTLATTNIITGAPFPAFQGGVLSPTGNVIMAPWASGNIGIVNPGKLTYSNIGPASNLAGAVLLPNGNVFFGGILGNSAVYNTSCVASPLGGNLTNVFTGTSNIQSVFLSPNGNVVGLPSQGQNIVSVNGFTSSNVACGGSFMGGAVLPSGNLVCASWKTANVGMFDTRALTFSNLAGSTGAGATLLQDGRVVFVPVAGNVGLLSTMVPADPAWCLGPYFNKF